jgi:hypothetical protein
VLDTRLWNFELDMPFLLLALGFILSIAFWLIGTFTQRFRGRRWKMAVAPFSFAFMGLLGLFATVRFKIQFLNEWLANSPTLEPHFEGISLSILLLGYLVFGALGCWLAVRLAHPLDRAQTLKTLYTAVKTRK